MTKAQNTPIQLWAMWCCEKLTKGEMTCEDRDELHWVHVEQANMNWLTSVPKAGDQKH